MIQTFADAESLMRGAAALFVGQAHQAMQERGRFSVALAGGKTPVRAYELLALDPCRSEIDWCRVHVFWTDERCVSPEDANSNYRMARTALLDRVPIAPTQIHRIQGEVLPKVAARQYESALSQHFSGETVRFDLVLLGLGTDAHTASLFPGSPALGERTHLATEVYVAEQEMCRVTLTVPALNAARVIVFLVSGAEKAEILYRVVVGPHQPERLPAQLVRPMAGQVFWLVDRAAASRLPAPNEAGTGTTSCFKE